MKIALELLESAYKDETISVVVDMNGVKGVLDYAMSIDMFVEQEKFKMSKRMEYVDKGYAGKPIDERKWEEELERAKPEHKERLLKTKPKDAADQFADIDTQFMMIKSLIPKYIRFADGAEKGKLMFSDEKAQEEGGRFIMNHPKLRDKIISAIIELYAKIDEVGETAKNLSKPESSTS